jgi:hypothetical protein
VLNDYINEINKRSLERQAIYLQSAVRRNTRDRLHLKKASDKERTDCSRSYNSDREAGRADAVILKQRRIVLKSDFHRYEISLFAFLLNPVYIAKASY